MDTISEPVTILTPDEAWERLETQKVGRLATRVVDFVDIVPINYVVDDKTIVFRTASGSKLSQLTINGEVVFEADSFDAETGWSVVIHGTATRVETEAEIFALEKLPLKPFVATIKPNFVRIKPHKVSARYFVFGPEPRREDLQEG